MSVVIGFKQKDKVWLACDKQVTTGDRKSFLNNHHKIILYNKISEIYSTLAINQQQNRSR
jgi:hypothetical protein